jgi:hypothetical protein
MALELHVNDGAHDLGDPADLVGCCSHLIYLPRSKFIP